ncbi:MAG: exodeoxyribonuclease V, partial [Acidobacteriota bacterium]|nr:exodeoxyribonuclease V [Acidobacteriota bacterium]
PGGRGVAPTPGGRGVAPTPGGRGVAPTPGGRGVQSPLSIARFTRDLDLRWRRSSYSSVTESAHSRAAAIRRADRPAPAPTEPEHGGVADEPDPDPGRATPAEPSPRSAGPGSWGSPLAGLPAGPAVGTFVHRVLERADFAAGDLRAELVAAVADCARRGGAPTDPVVLVDGLQAALSTPLGPGAGGAPLAGTERGDRIDELGFELPLAGGDRPRGQVRPADIGAVLRRHLGPGDRLSGYADRLDDPLLETALRGYLNGSLDLVFRRAAPVGPPRWYVVDYKTNWLGREPGDLLVSDYRPEFLDAEMQRCHYPLQALIYVVALHRYLRWRLAGYRPETHLGGVAYLFLRGMAGPLTPTEGGVPYGVWSWAVPPPLVTALSDLFDSGRSSS